MKRAAVVSFCLLVCSSGCIARERLNAHCQWSHDAASPRDIGNAVDQAHLSNDAMVAEELAIRYADAQRGHRSGHFAGMDEYVKTREQCMATFFGVIAKNHRVN